MEFNSVIDTMTVHVHMTEYGDALIYGQDGLQRPLEGMVLKQRLFAWDETSYYGTELGVQQAGDTEIVLLPAEQVLPFFAAGAWPVHIEWHWNEDATRLQRLAPLLIGCLRAGHYAPDLQSFRNGSLHWSPDPKALKPSERSLVKELRVKRKEVEQQDSGFAQGILAAFSASVFHECYGTQEQAADLRRDYPALFATEGVWEGMDEQTWLAHIGWTAETMPFRPLLQLLEPIIESEMTDADMSEANSVDTAHPEPEWHLQLVLQAIHDHAELYPIWLDRDGQAHGSWPELWTATIRERSESWTQRIQACLPGITQQAIERAEGSSILDKPLSNLEAWQFLTVDSKRLLESGWQVLLPAWWEAASRRKPRLRAKLQEGEGEARGRSFFGLNSLIEFDWRIAIGEQELSEEDFAALVARNERLVRFREQWIPLDPALLEQIRQAMRSMNRKRGLSFQDVLQLQLRGGYIRIASEGETEASDGTEDASRLQLEVELNDHLQQVIERLTQQSDWPLLPAPSGLQAELRSYQLQGFSWMAYMRSLGLGGCLADDMGLGKTIQFITYLLHVKETRQAALSSAGHGKRHEATSDEAQITDTSQRTRPSQTTEAEYNSTSLPSWLAEHAEPGASLLICPTSVLGNWQKELQRFAPSLRIMLHYGSGRAKDAEFATAVASADIVLTSFATAALDQELLQKFTWESLCLDEAQNIKNAQTRQSAAVRTFPAKHRIALTGTPIENRLAELWSIYDFANPGYLGSAQAFQNRFAKAIEKDGDEHKTAELQKLVQPFMLRRKKKDPSIQLDLPDKNEMKTYIHLTPEQSALYDQTVRELMSQVQVLEGMKRKGAILSALTKLKQLCNHPVLLTKEDISSTMSGATSLTEVEQEMNDAAMIARSSKLERLLGMVQELREADERCLIFTQYLGMGNILQQILQRVLGEPVLYLHGGTSKKARDRMIDEFQSDALPPSTRPAVFILSIKAGGVGLNLTAANHVFHFDRWWNPAVENQATDRAYRMGQTKDVQVHKFIALGTLEERIDEMLESKQQLSEHIISSSEGWITELTTEELGELITLRKDWTASDASRP